MTISNTSRAGVFFFFFFFLNNPNFANFCPENEEIISFSLTKKTCFLQKFPKFLVERNDKKLLTLIKIQECQSEGVWKAESNAFKLL
jgi:hypothetical protein